MEETAADFMIEAAGVQKVYAAGGLRVRALRWVDLGVRRGEMVAIMGPSGSGKTTLLNVLSGLEDLSDGEVYVDGESIKGMSDRRRTRFRAQKMGFIFQSYNLIPVLSAIENIELPLLVAGSKPKKARQWAQDAIEMVGLADQAKKRPAEMSGGQQQRITVARSLVNNPAIVWADEPTGALDSETSKGIMDLLVRMNEREQQTFVLVTHDAAVAARAHRTIRMRDGLIASDKSNGKGE
ncbi:MAG: ABC transporter ATP-binding protein [Actinomycetota bacterium]|nr:ABC transporter ATP-binding protein [Actinomycetota bacterium]